MRVRQGGLPFVRPAALQRTISVCLHAYLLLPSLLVRKRVPGGTDIVTTHSSFCVFLFLGPNRLTNNNTSSLVPAFRTVRNIVGQKTKTVAEDEYEKALINAVIPPSEVGEKIDHLGALENVKTTLQELVTLPLQRPELFSGGNLTRPCKGVLLFGPLGTCKSLLAKVVATEAGANFINVTGSTITSKWFGDAEKLTKALLLLLQLPFLRLVAVALVVVEMMLLMEKLSVCLLKKRWR
ncbi:unnamed protein product [Sphagnum balticum]